MADSSKITIREQVGRPLTYEELDANFQESQVVIDDFNDFTQSQNQKDEEQDTALQEHITAYDEYKQQQSQKDAQQDQALADHVAAADPHPQYFLRVQNNQTATREPTATDDADDGYEFQSLWVDNSQTNPEIYRCLDATVGAAVWVKTSLTLDELGSAATTSTEYLLSRENHTGTQTASTISDFTNAVQQVDDPDVVHAPGSGKENEAGDAYSYDVGTDAGQLMKVGDFGIGVQAQNDYPSTDLNADPLQFRSDVYRATSNTSNKPAGTTGIVYLSRYNSGSATMMYVERTSGVATIFVRSFISDTWSDWTQFISSGTIKVGSGSPEGSVTANPGTLYIRTDGTNVNRLWMKSTGTSNTGWLAVPTMSAYTEGSWRIKLFSTGDVELHSNNVSLSLTNTPSSASLTLPISVGTLDSIQVTINSTTGSWGNTDDRFKYIPNARSTSATNISLVIAPIAGQTFTGTTGAVNISAFGHL